MSVICKVLTNLREKNLEHRGAPSTFGCWLLLQSSPDRRLPSLPLGWPAPTWSHFADMPGARKSEWGPLLFGHIQEGQRSSPHTLHVVTDPF